MIHIIKPGESPALFIRFYPIKYALSEFMIPLVSSSFWFFRPADWLVLFGDGKYHVLIHHGETLTKVRPNRKRFKNR
jgi:hypothetical protein